VRIDSYEHLAFLSPAQGADDELRIDLSPVEWICPLGVVGVLATALSAAVRNRQVEVVLPAAERVRRFLQHSGFNTELLARGWEVPSEAAGLAEPFAPRLPVTALSLERDVEDMGIALGEALSGVVPANLVESIHTVVGELTNNAREHGILNPGHGSCYPFVQTFTGRTSGREAGIEVAVADFGPGFAKTLAGFGPMSDVEAISKGLEAGVSGTGRRDKGFGLYWVQEHVDTHPGATLVILSRGGVVTRREGRSEAQRTAEAFGGTLATAFFPCELYTRDMQKEAP
jgi:anti-sigma regulatory factor (Ser/Thr protein kinase)